MVYKVTFYNLSYLIGGDKELKSGFQGTTDSPSKIALSFYDAMWAYDGW